MPEEFKALEGKKSLLKKVDYDEFYDKLDGFYTGLFLIGGPWCRHCQSVIGLANDIATKAGLSEIIYYDPRFIDVFSEEDDLRRCSSLENKLKYYHIVEKIGYKSDELVRDTLIPKIHVPFFIAMKNGTCVGYYTARYVKDEAGLHEDGKSEDKTVEVIYNLTELCDKVKEDLL